VQSEVQLNVTFYRNTDKTMKNFAYKSAVFTIVWLSLLTSGLAQTAVSNQEVSAKVGEYMNALVNVKGFGGAVVVARDGKAIVSRGYGMADVELNVPNTAQTTFRIGSLTKQFTAAAIMLLQERGKLNVRDNACKYLTDCPAAWQNIRRRNFFCASSMRRLLLPETRAVR